MSIVQETRGLGRLSSPRGGHYKCSGSRMDPNLAKRRERGTSDRDSWEAELTLGLTRSFAFEGRRTLVSLHQFTTYRYKDSGG
jgi:hypothetical protein